jgi:uncharacterized protein YggE
METQTGLYIMKKTTLAATLFLFLIGCSAQAQLAEDQRTISINMSATEMVDADQIIFNVNMNAEGDTPQEAYDLHKQREAVLAGLLKEFDIKEENISFQPIRINKRSRNNNRDQYSVTNQQVSVTFSDFEIYEQIQVSLIKNNFDSFNASFSSSELEKGKEMALASAIESAKQKAEFIASNAGVSLGKVLSINHSDHVVMPYRESADAMMARSAASPGMMDFSQTVSVSANINITFAIGD